MDHTSNRYNANWARNSFTTPNSNHFHSSASPSLLSHSSLLTHHTLQHCPDALHSLLVQPMKSANDNRNELSFEPGPIRSPLLPNLSRPPHPYSRHILHSTPKDAEPPHPRPPGPPNPNAGKTHLPAFACSTQLPPSGTAIQPASPSPPAYPEARCAVL